MRPFPTLVFLSSFIAGCATTVNIPREAPMEGAAPAEAAPVPAPEGHAWIPGGPALIGDVLGVGAEDERPARIVEVSGFWMGRREVTNAEFAAFLSAQPDVDPRWIDLGSRKCRITGPAPGDGAYGTDATDLPVVMVSHFGAEAYCRWRTEVTGLHHRLPTETEWEKAARGPEGYTYAYGNVYTRALANQESGTLRPVASYAPNGYGLFDMTGNVFEWMGNEYAPERSGEPMNQALRGGSFVLDGMYLRNSFRMRQSRSVMTDDIGFRTACDGPRGRATDG